MPNQPPNHKNVLIPEQIETILNLFTSLLDFLWNVNDPKSKHYYRVEKAFVEKLVEKFINLAHFRPIFHTIEFEKEAIFQIKALPLPLIFRDSDFAFVLRKGIFTNILTYLYHVFHNDLHSDN